MFWSRSNGIVDSVFLRGIVLPGGSTLPFVPGVQSTKYSPISDCGRDWQKASERNWPKPRWVTVTWTSAKQAVSPPPLEQFCGSSIVPILPAGTPATLKSEPEVRPNALSSWIVYWPDRARAAGAHGQDQEHADRHQERAA